MPVRKIILMLLALSLIIISGCGHKQKSLNADEQRCRENLVSAFVGLFDEEIYDIQTDLALLAMTGGAMEGNWEKVKPLLALYQERHPHLLAFYMRPDGSYYRTDTGLTDKNLADRAYFPELEAGKAVLGEIVIGKTSGKKSLIAAAPIMADGKFKGAMGSAIFVNELGDSLRKTLSLDEEMFAFAYDPDKGLIFGGSAKALLCDEAAHAFKNKVKGRALCRLGGKKIIIDFRTSATTGWRLGLGRVVD